MSVEVGEDQDIAQIEGNVSCESDCTVDNDSKWWYTTPGPTNSRGMGRAGRTVSTTIYQPKPADAYSTHARYEGGDLVDSFIISDGKTTPCME